MLWTCLTNKPHVADKPPAGFLLIIRLFLLYTIKSHYLYTCGGLSIGNHRVVFS